jgi:predicted RNA-binding protein with PUA-like domain
MAYWLVKSEPGTWSWDQHAAAGADAWTGVRNHQAKLYLNAMKSGDQVLYYHSGEERAVVGASEVVAPAYPDPTDPTGKFVAVDIKAKAPLPRAVGLSEIKAQPDLAGMVLVKNSRLSVQPVTAEEWEAVNRLAAKAA